MMTPSLLPMLALAIAAPAQAQNTAAPTRDWLVGAGAQRSFAEAGNVQGLRLIGSRSWAALDLGLELYTAGSTDRVRPLTEALLQIQPFVAEGVALPETVDRSSAALLLGWSVVAAERRRPRDGGAWLDAGPRVYVGPELRQVQTNKVYYEGESLIVEMDSRTLLPGARAGVGLDLGVGGLSILRFAIAQRVRPPVDPGTFAGLPNTPQWETTATFDLLVSL